MLVATLTRIHNFNDYAGRAYYRSENGVMYCIDLDSNWYRCSKDGEPQEQVAITPDSSFIGIIFNVD